jgi:hypothetical protein
MRLKVKNEKRKGKGNIGRMDRNGLKKWKGNGEKRGKWGVRIYVGAIKIKYGWILSTSILMGKSGRTFSIQWRLNS